MDSAVNAILHELFNAWDSSIHADTKRDRDARRAYADGMSRALFYLGCGSDDWMPRFADRAASHALGRRPNHNLNGEFDRWRTAVIEDTAKSVAIDNARAKAEMAAAFDAFTDMGAL